MSTSNRISLDHIIIVITGSFDSILCRCFVQKWGIAKIGCIRAKTYIIGSWCFYQTESFLCLPNWKSKKLATKASGDRMLEEDWSHQQDAVTESDQIY